MRTRLSRNFRKFPPPPQYPDHHLSIPGASPSITFSISTTFPVSCFKATSAYFDHSGYLGGAVSLVVAKPSASPSAVGWFIRGNEIRVPFQLIAWHSNKLILLREIQGLFFFAKDQSRYLSSSLYNFDIKYLNDCTSQITLHYNHPCLRSACIMVELLTFRAALRACYASRRLKRRKSERDGAMFRKSWSWNVKEARGLRRRRMTMPWEKLD